VIACTIKIFPNLYEFISCPEHKKKDILKNDGNQTVDVSQ